MVVVIVAQSLLRHGVEVTFTEEHGGMERASLLLWLYAAGFALFSKAYLKAMTWPLALFFLLLALRELDFHNWWFDPGLLRGEIFSSDAPLWQKVVSAIAMTSILGVVLFVVFGGFGKFFAAMREKRIWPWLVVAALVFAFLSTLLDGIGPRLRHIGIEVNDAMHLKITMGEEVLELLFSLLLVSAIIFGVHSLAQSTRR
ncbi:hypothetical protein [Roseicyclus elongatus]|nr:hypothetical protein [Roseibacterium elongatum]